MTLAVVLASFRTRLSPQFAMVQANSGARQSFDLCWSRKTSWEEHAMTVTSVGSNQLLSGTTVNAGDTVDVLDGGTVLPGFRLPLAQLFAELDRHG